MEKKQKRIKLYVLIFIVFMLVSLVTTIIFKNARSKEIQNKIKQLQEPQGNEVVNKDDNKKLSGDSDFDLRILKLYNENKNTIYSPLSIKYALKMLEEGAEGNTKKEISSVVGNMDLTKYENIDNVLSLANSIYIKDTFKDSVKEEYTNTLKSKYNAEVQYDGFTTAANINRWIEDKTLGIIKNMLNDGQISDPNLRMLLINALAIDMEWYNSFDQTDTYGREFNKVDGSKVFATTMSMENSSDALSYYTDKDVTAVSMDLRKYNDTQLEFIAIMPNKDLNTYINDVTDKDLSNTYNGLRPASSTSAGIILTIPRFKFDYSLSLVEALKTLGINEAFTGSADFSNMSDIPLFVSDAIHKADVEFSEKGIKAAAVTVIFMTETAMLQDDTDKPIEINFNKPFMFVIKDKNTNEIWFVGSVYEPNLWENDKADYQLR